MNHAWLCTTAALSLGCSLVVQPLELLARQQLPAPVELARAGGGRVGGGGGARGGSGARTGFASFGGGASRPQARSGPVETRQGSRSDRTELRQTNRTDRVGERSITRRDAINTWDGNRPAWVNNNWARNRPWRYGWYGGSTWTSWNWWPGRAAAWGIGSLATFAAIDSLVVNSVDNQTSYIVVPDTEYSLYYSSVQVSGELVTFQAASGSTTLTFRADCRGGTLNGYPPQSGAEAQLLNAACQVAFGQ